MGLDVGTITALRNELAGTLRGGKIEKIRQPESDLLLFDIRAHGETYKLLIRSSGPNARVHLTRQRFDNPREAPMFCMLLRKYLTGSIILDVMQPNGDRILALLVESRNELGDRAQMELVAELTGRATNVVLVDADGRIVDCMKKIAPSETTGRAMLPGLRYRHPELPPSGIQTMEVPDVSGISAILDERYACLERTELQRRRSQDLVKSVRRARDRQYRKLVAQREEYARTERMEEVRKHAELLQANLWNARKGDCIIRCENYFEDGSPAIELELDPTKTPQQNLASRFRNYRKLRGAREHLSILLEDGEKQLDYLNSVLEELSRAETEQDLSEIRTELQETGLLKASAQRGKGKSTGKKARKPIAAAPLQFEAPDDFRIFVGKNNAQNDELTTKTARRTDYWFHTKELHGSHVILCCDGREPTKAAMERAAELAAYYSQGRENGLVAVDCAMVRDVRKPRGALPGKVIYSNYKTILVRRETI
ncbi:MAG: NFACT family protein [Oscillospiraceae bacterium]|nr:NFACT family protein [Oscillospiraceae bacterium]